MALNGAWPAAPAVPPETTRAVIRAASPPPSRASTASSPMPGMNAVAALSGSSRKAVMPTPKLTGKECAALKRSMIPLRSISSALALPTSCAAPSGIGRSPSETRFPSAPSGAYLALYSSGVSVGEAISGGSSRPSSPSGCDG